MSDLKTVGRQKNLRGSQKLGRGIKNLPGAAKTSGDKKVVTKKTGVY